MKKVFAIIGILCLGLSSALAQTVQVSGTVTGAEDGQPLPGVSVVVKGTTQGTVTNVNGKYSLDVPANATLQFSFVGMATQEIAVSNRQAIDVVMQTGAQEIDEVVITASGMGRLERSLGYGASTVKAADLVAGKSSDAMTGLIGKIPGVSISSAGASGTSQKVIVRGFSSLTGSNQPLYVIDGMPFYNNTSGRAEMNNAIDFGNQANDVNPENIESVTILKGASATALYGSRAANGVVMITTKNGRQNERVKVTYDLTVMGSNVLRVPQTQNTFGQGWYYSNDGYAGLGDVSYLGNWADVEQGSWGSRLDGRAQEWNTGPYHTYNPDDPRYREPRVGYFTHKKNSVRDFYETGLEMANTITISGGGKNTGFFASYSNFRSNGVLPTNMDMYKRNTFTFRGNTKFLNDRAVVNYSISYARKDKKDAMAGQGGNGSTIYQDILQNPVNHNITDYKDWNDVYNNADNFYTPYAMNPYWTLAHNNATYQDDRVWGNVELNVDLVKGLKAIGRVSGDFTTAEQEFKNDKWMISDDSWSAAFGGSNEFGWFRQSMNRWNQIDAQVMLNADYKLGDFSINGLAGWNVNQRTASEVSGEFQELIEPGWFSFNNSSANVPSYSSFSQRRLLGLLAQGDIGYKNFAFLTLSARNDWSSTLPAANRSFFYWGANMSLIMTDMLPSIKSDVLNFAKLRAAYGQTGNDASVYLTESSYVKSSMGVSFATIEFPLSGNPGYNISTRIPAGSLKPEITTEAEFGVDLRFFQNRFTVDFSYYDRNTVNQIMNLGVAAETGYASRTANVGKIGNRGVELLLGVTPVRTNDFNWNVSYTLSRNRSKVKELWPGTDKFSIYSLTGGIAYVAKVGEPLGIFEFDSFVQVEDGEHQGKYVVNSDGWLQTDPNSKQTLGTSEYKFIMGLTNQFRYKNWSLGFTFDWRHGGMMYSAQKGVMYFVGTAPNTADNNRNSFVVPNSVRQVGVENDTQKPIYAENNIPVDMSYGGFNAYWYDSINNSMNIESSMIDRSYIKFREMNLTCAFPKEWFPSFISGLELSLVGRNLLLWTPKGQGFVDPDVTNYGNDLTSQFGEFYAAPSTRVFGGSLKIVF
jgi:TonB-linked SusC/RagA family outer membrane protein